MISSTGTRANHNGAHAAFTFLELLIVTAIVAILVSMNLPRFRRTFENFRLTSLSDRFSAAVKAAREMALIDGRSYLIRISDTPPSFSLLVERRDRAEEFEPLTGAAGRAVRIPQTFTLDARPKEILFHPDASATRAEITFSNAAGDEIEFEITEDGKIK